MDHSTPGSPVLHYLPEFAQIHVHWVSDAIEPSHPLPAPSPFNFNLSQHQALFQWVGSSYQVAKVLEFHFRISPSNEYSELISFRIDWFDLFAIQKTLEDLLQLQNLKASNIWHLVFFIVQLLYLYMATRKTIALNIWTFNSKVMSLLCNILSRCVIGFLPISNSRLLSWLQSPSTVILENKNIKSVTAASFFPI